MTGKTKCSLLMTAPKHPTSQSGPNFTLTSQSQLAELALIDPSHHTDGQLEYFGQADSSNPGSHQDSPWYFITTLSSTLVITKDEMMNVQMWHQFLVQQHRLYCTFDFCSTIWSIVATKAKSIKHYCFNVQLSHDLRRKPTQPLPGEASNWALEIQATKTG